MKIVGVEIRLYAPWVHSLKEKRMIVKSLVSKIQNHFHVSAAEVGEQDVHQTIVIGVASIVPHRAQADRFAGGGAAVRGGEHGRADHGCTDGNLQLRYEMGRNLP